jgi:hypothetical protein
MKGYLSKIQLKIVQGKLSLGLLCFGEFCQNIVDRLDKNTILQSKKLSKSNKALQYKVSFPNFVLVVHIAADEDDLEVLIHAENMNGATYQYLFDDLDGELEFSSRKQHGKNYFVLVLIKKKPNVVLMFGFVGL